MKKKFFLIGALVVMSMSTMFVACNQNTPTNGCKCSYYEEGELTGTYRVTLAMMKEGYGITTCTALEAAFLEEAGGAVEGVDVMCEAY